MDDTSSEGGKTDLVQPFHSNLNEDEFIITFDISKIWNWKQVGLLEDIKDDSLTWKGPNSSKKLYMKYDYQRSSSSEFSSSSDEDEETKNFFDGVLQNMYWQNWEILHAY